MHDVAFGPWSPGGPDSPFQGSMADFANPRGRDLLERTARFYAWQERRRSAGFWPYSSQLDHPPLAHTVAAPDSGAPARRGLNFASQDYLSLSSHPRVRAAVVEALDRFGPHSAGSACLQGNTRLSRSLEAALGDFLGYDSVTLYPTGWAAGFGVITGLVRGRDHVVLDSLAHNCLARGAAAATRNVHRVAHNDVGAFRAALMRIRGSDARNAILLVTEGLFSMDADRPRVDQLQSLCREYGATLLVDVAHDLGAMGSGGFGTLGEQGMRGRVDLIMGSFSKTFASNGGFVASNGRAVHEYLKFNSPTHTFSNALSPVQSQVVLTCLEIVRSAEGDALRQRLLRAVRSLREALADGGVECLGTPSPIVPVPLGGERSARLMSRSVTASGLFANLVEYPAVSVGAARFRMQVMADHTPEDAEAAAAIILAAAQVREEHHPTA